MATDPLTKRLLRNALNAWCATGKGGGKDNSCSPNGGGGLKFGSPAFQKWFSGSKVVDRDGNPLVVFHGTTKDFDSFQTDLPKDKDWGMLDRALGAHFAEDPSVTDTFTIGQYVWPGTDSVSDRPGESFYRDTNGELRYDGIPVVIMQDENGKETVTPYDPKIHGGTWGIADRLGHSAYLRVLPPGGRVLPVFLSIRNPLHVEPIGRESDQSAVSRVVGALAFGHDRDLFVSAMSSTGRGEETAGKIWDLLSQGKEYDGGPYEKYKSFEDVSKNFPGMLNGRENAERAKSILRDLGYDGILYTNTSDNEVKGDASRRTWIAFDVGQIKSAIGNRGTFDPTDKNIRNAFCPTGKGGGKDNSCPPQRQSSGIDEVEVFGRPVRLYRNPSEQQLKALFEKYPGDRFGDSVRGIVDFTTGDMYAWKGSEAPHFGVEDVLGGLDRWWEFHNADEGDNAVTLKKALSEWKAIKNDLTNNAWCATGKGGGKDNSCPPTGEGGRSKSKAKKAKSSGLMMVEVKEYDPMDDDPYRDADLIKVRVYRNPTFDEAKAIKTKDNELRGLFDGETGNYYLWDSAKAYHEDMAEGLGIDYENTDQELWYLGIKEEVDHLKRVVTKWRRMGNQVGNAWCPTGEGGGKDNSCSPNRSDVPKFDVNGTYPVYHVTSDVYLPSILQRGLGSPDLKNYNPTQKQTPLLSHGVVSWTRDPAYAINEGKVRLVISDKQKLHHAGFLTEESVAMLATDATGDTLEPGVNEFEEITQGIVPSKLIDRIEMPNSLYVKMQKDLGNYKRWSNDAAEAQKTVEIGSRKYKMLGLRHESYKQSYQELKQILDDPRLHVGNFYRRDWKSGEVLTDNAWCPTGEGGGKDNSCPPHNAGTAVASVHDASKKIKFSDALVSDKLITRDTPDLIIKTLTPAETKEFNDKLQKEYEKRRAELKGDLTDGEFNYKHGDRIRGMIKKEMTQKMFDEHPDWFMATVRPNQMRDEMWYSIGYDRDQVSIRTDSGAKFQVKSNASTFKSESMKKPGISYSVDPATQAEKISKKDFDQLYAKVTPSIIAHVERYKPEVVTLAAKTAAKKELYNDIAKTITETHPQYFAAYQDVENNIRFYTVGLKSMQQEIMDSVPKHAGWTSKMRVLNAWCPTGKGGGKDNSCSPNSTKEFQGRKVLVGTYGMSAKKTDEEIRRVAPLMKKVTAAWKSAIRKIDPKAKIEVRVMGDYLDKIDKPLTSAWVSINGKSKGENFGLSLSLHAHADGNTVKMNDSDLPKHLQRKGIFSAGVKVLLRPEFNLSGKMGVHHSSNDKAWQKIADKHGLDWKAWQKGNWVDVKDKDLEKFRIGLTTNAWCPTGKGGGKDNSCSPNENRRSPYSVEKIDVPNGTATVLVNPSITQAKEFTKRKQYGVRAIVDGANLYLWDSEQAVHSEIANAMKIEGTGSQFVFYSDGGAWEWYDPADGVMRQGEGLDAFWNHVKTVATNNAWCPTGKGGGKDNSCSPYKTDGGFGPPPDVSDRVKELRKRRDQLDGLMPDADERIKIVIAGAEAAYDRFRQSGRSENEWMESDEREQINDALNQAYIKRGELREQIETLDKNISEVQIEHIPTRDSVVGTPLQGMSWDEAIKAKGEDWVLKQMQDARGREKEWERKLKYDLSMGRLNEQQARDKGYHNISGRPYLPLPSTLYHVTTAADAVEKSGLQTRDELRQDKGKGLGGGDSDTISFTDSSKIADDIYAAMKEAHAVARGDISLDELVSAAKEGRGAKYPFFDKLMDSYVGDKNSAGEPHEFQLIREGKKIDYSRGGWDRHVTDMTPREKQDAVFDVYKKFAAHRESAGGALDPLFFLADTENFSKVPSDQIKIVKVQSRPGAQGFQVSALGEWRTHTGDAVTVDGVPYTARLDEARLVQNLLIRNVKTSGKYSSTQVNILEPLASQILEWTRANVPQEWYADDGIENQPHITVKYGLHTDNADDVRRVIEDQPPIHARIGQLSVFEVEKPNGAKFDVLKFEILSDDLQRISKIINDSLPHTDTYAVYQPHMTLVYLKPGFGRQFIGKDNPFTGMDLIFDEVNYSNKQQVHTPIDLIGAETFNAFCSTGKGGGKDNSCSPNENRWAFKKGRLQIVMDRWM